MTHRTISSQKTELGKIDCLHSFNLLEQTDEKRKKGSNTNARQYMKQDRSHVKNA